MHSVKNTDECTLLGALLAWRSADLSLDQLGAIKREMNVTGGCTPVYRYTWRCRLDQLGAVEREERSNLILTATGNLARRRAFRPLVPKRRR